MGDTPQEPPPAEGEVGVVQVDDDRPAPTTNHGGFSNRFRSVLRWFAGESVRSEAVKGRALIRTYTSTAVSPDDAGQATEDECHSVTSAAPSLERVHSGGLVHVGDVKVGRVRPPRMRSSSPGRTAKVAGTRTNQLHVPVEHHDREERPSSVPPPLSWAQKIAASSAATQVAAEAPQQPGLKRTISKEVSKEVKSVLSAPHGRNLQRDVRRQLRFVVAGLMGSGKSTLCRMLADLLDGVWVNQDEFSHLKKGAKRAFLMEIKKVSSNRRVPVLIVDKINTLVQHRAEILESMNSGAPGDVVFIQVAHPKDRSGSLQHQKELCLSRIRSRGEGHRCLLGSNPKLESILRMTADGAQPMDAKELSRFTAHFNVDMTLAPSASVMHLLADLDAHDLLGRFHVDELVTQERLEKALQVTMRVEKSLAPDTVDTAKKANSKTKEAPIWIWQASVAEPDSQRIIQAWEGAVNAEENGVELLPQKAFHCTLLYVGGGSETELLSRHPHLQTSGAIRELRQKLADLDRTEMDVQLTNIVWDDHIACAEVANFQDLSANQYAHVTIATGPRVPPVVSNELLCRRAANSDFEAGLGPWLQQLGLGSYLERSKDICREHGIDSADEMASMATEIAAALETDGDQQHRLKNMLSRAAPGPVRESPLSPPLTLRVTVHGKRRGE